MILQTWELPDGKGRRNLPMDTAHNGLTAPRTWSPLQRLPRDAPLPPPSFSLYKLNAIAHFKYDVKLRS